MPKIELKVIHTHAGAVYPAGSVIDVDEHAARWLIERGIGARIGVTPNPALDGMVDVPPAAPEKRSRKQPSAKE